MDNYKTIAAQAETKTVIKKARSLHSPSILRQKKKPCAH